MPKYKEYSVLHSLSDFESKKISYGQLIYISGYLTFGDDKHNLWGNEEGYKYIRETMPPLKDPAWRDCISLIYYGKFRKTLLKYNEKYVVVLGHISRHMPKSDEVNLGSCNRSEERRLGKECVSTG